MGVDKGVDKRGFGVEDGNLGIMVPGVGGWGIEAVNKEILSCYLKALFLDSRGKKSNLYTYITIPYKLPPELPYLEYNAKQNLGQLGYWFALHFKMVGHKTHELKLIV